MLLVTVRSSLARVTYMPSEACALVLKYRACLSKEQVAQIRGEIKHCLAVAEKSSSRSGLSIRMDEYTWTEFQMGLSATEDH